MSITAEAHDKSACYILQPYSDQVHPVRHIASNRQLHFSSFSHYASTKAYGVENRPSAKMRGTPKSLSSENHTKSQWNARNSSKVLYIIEKKQI
jgi:hypothetical protein